MTENELIQGCMNGDRKSQQRLYEAYAGLFMTMCRRYAENQEQAEDIFQEGFIKIFKSISTFRFQGSFEGWMKRIIVNTAINHVRKKKNEVLVDEMKDFHEEELNEDETYDINEEQLLKLINSLPEGYKHVFNMFAIEGYSHKEIGAMLNITESTSRSQLTKARKYLQKLLKQYQWINEERKQA